jgi:hypothetical protein
MAPFDFVCAFYSVVLGVAVAQLMTDLGRLIEHRDHVRRYWVHTLWIVTVLIASLGNWWSMWSVRGLKTWTFYSFALVVAFAAAIYLATVLLFPRIPETTQIVDLRKHFYKNRRIFFSATAGFWSLGITCNATFFSLSVLDLWIIVPGLLVLLSIVAAITANPRYHGAFAVAAASVNICLIVFVAGGAPISPSDPTEAPQSSPSSSPSSASPVSSAPPAATPSRSPLNSSPTNPNASPTPDGAPSG